MPNSRRVSPISPPLQRRTRPASDDASKDAPSRSRRPTASVPWREGRLQGCDCGGQLARDRVQTQPALRTESRGTAHQNAGCSFRGQPRTKDEGGSFRPPVRRLEHPHCGPGARSARRAVDRVALRANRLVSASHYESIQCSRVRL
jgi:hypothetical protein